ncbi:MAG: ACT domain-containing protein [Clostridiales bacterium]|jgi:ACT domain-containing protein|nr:ACT domain-containing protein [Clostridiales bacterium]
MDKKEQAVVTVVGKNDIGILARVATAIAEAKASIVQVSQIVMDEYFTMNMLIDISSMEGNIPGLESELKDRLPGMEIHVMHENIFNSMHSI